ncbi:TNF receptor-associated factor family protein DDB_G0290931-like [Triticum dicoccoides]|uniref:TNF receptor-associated factor family protein DDB_G0290931-like n=1 Tax=Triticum dicoccoides TaxID=85692 RepID=UPI00162E3116|nr:TNF receptor-associated factor family protein DDB_G0290931-like [Triticum dicoccoides]
MGNTGSTSPASLGKSHVPHLQWKVHDFSALLETGAKSAKSAHFHCSGYKWFLKVTPPMHQKPGAETPYVGLSLKLGRTTLKPGDTVNAVFELSVYNHAKKIYYGRKASHNFDLNNTCSKDECLIPLQKLLKSSAFLVDDSCVFGVKILKIKVCSPERKGVMVLKKATTLQNLFIQKKGLIKGTYTWTMDNYHELDLKRYVCSPTFEVGGHKWHVGMYPHGCRNITGHISLFLYLESSDKLCDESGKVVELTLSILDQKNGKHSTITSGLSVFGGDSSWGWPKFLTVNRFKDPSRGYLLGSRCVVKADFTIVGSSNDG